MRNRKILLLLLIVNCQLKAAAQEDLEKIYLNPKAPDRAVQSMFVDSLTFVPLTGSDFKVGDHNYVWPAKYHFVLLNYSDKNIAVYSRAGEFMGNINFKGTGNDFTPSVNVESNRIIFRGTNRNYKLTAKDREMINRNWNDPRNRKYFKQKFVDLSDSTLTLHKDKPSQLDMGNAVKYGENGHITGNIATGGKSGDDSTDYEIKIYRDGKMVKGFFPYNQFREKKFLHGNERVNFFPTPNDDEFFVSRPFCDTIFRLKNDCISPVYKILLPMANAPSTEIFKKRFKNKADRTTISLENGWVFNSLYNFDAVGRFIVFSAMYLANYENYIYSTVDRKAYNIKYIRPDSSHYNIDVLNGYGIARSKDRFYKIIKGAELVDFFGKNKHIKPPVELREFLHREDASARPVLVTFKMKK